MMEIYPVEDETFVKNEHVVKVHQNIKVINLLAEDEDAVVEGAAVDREEDVVVEEVDLSYLQVLHSLQVRLLSVVMGE